MDAYGQELIPPSCRPSCLDSPRLTSLLSSWLSESVLNGHEWSVSDGTMRDVTFHLQQHKVLQWSQWQQGI